MAKMNLEAIAAALAKGTTNENDKEVYADFWLARDDGSLQWTIKVKGQFKGINARAVLAILNNADQAEEALATGLNTMANPKAVEAITASLQAKAGKRKPAKKAAKPAGASLADLLAQYSN